MNKNVHTQKMHTSRDLSRRFLLLITTQRCTTYHITRVYSLRCVTRIYTTRSMDELNKPAVVAGVDIRSFFDVAALPKKKKKKQDDTAVLATVDTSSSPPVVAPKKEKAGNGDSVDVFMDVTQPEGAASVSVCNVFAESVNSDRAQSNPLKKVKMDSGAAVPKKWKYGQTPAGPSCPGSKEIPVGKPNCLVGLTFVLSGCGESLSREDATDMLKKYGARVTTSISKKTDYLVAGTDAGERKLAQAREFSTKIINEDAVLRLITEKSIGWSASVTDIVTPTTSAVQLAPSGATPMQPVSSAILTTQSSAQELPILRSGLQSASSLSDMLWVDAHRPMSVSGIIGNPGLVKQVGDWLESWHDKRKDREKNMDPKLAAKVPKALLISGPPGIGQYCGKDSELVTK